MMHALERMLLYTVGLVCAGMLLFGSLSEDQMRNASAASDGSTASRDAVAGPTSDVRIAADSTTTQQSLILSDRQGRPRIELRLDDSGQPKIMLRDDAGTAVISLEVGTDNRSAITLASKAGTTRLASDEDGSMSLEMEGKRLGRIRMQVAEEGLAEIVATGKANSFEAVMRTNADGSAELAVRDPKRNRGPSLAMSPMDGAEIGIVADDGVTGPIMRVFQDGLAEIGIHGKTANSGPAMIRQADGVAVITLRDADGQPRTSMVTSPDGTAVIAATSTDGTRRAALRIAADGKPSIGITEGEKKPDDKKQQPAPPRTDSTMVSVDE